MQDKMINEYHGMIKKFWVVKDGQIGTAHKNKHGDMVDFRPHSHVVANSIINPARITLYPPRGQKLESLVLKCEKERVVLRKDFPYIGSCRYIEFCYTRWNGVKIGVYHHKNPFSEWYDPEKEYHFHEYGEKELNPKILEVLEKAKEVLSKIKLLDLVPKISRSNMDKIRNGNAYLFGIFSDLFVSELISNKIIKKDECGDYEEFLHPILNDKYNEKGFSRRREWEDILRMCVILYDEKKRAQRKIDWEEKNKK